MIAEDQEAQPASILSIEVNPGDADARAAALEPDDTQSDADAEAQEEPAGPPEIDAGSEVRLVGTIVCSPPRDLRDVSVLFRDADGSSLGEAQVIECKGETNTTAELVLKAPLQAGEYTWLAVLPAHTADGIDYEEVSTPFSLVVKAHATSMVVWDVPTAIVAGETFRFKVGVKCSSECRPSGWRFDVEDEGGNQVATAAPGDEPWPGTAALYYAEIEARAPEAEGLHDWTVKAPGPDLDVPHEAQSVRLGVRSVPQPDCVITVEAIDKASQSPIKGAKVLVHPYRVFTDERGRAQVRVSKGAYRIFVSGTKYIPYRADSEVAGDTSIRAELIVDRGLTDAELWS